MVKKIAKQEERIIFGTVGKNKDKVPRKYVRHDKFKFIPETVLEHLTVAQLSASGTKSLQTVFLNIEKKALPSVEPKPELVKPTGEPPVKA